MDIIEKFVERLKEFELVEPYKCEHSGEWYIVGRGLLLVIKRPESDCVTFRHCAKWVEEIMPEITRISEDRNLQLTTVLLTTAHVAGRIQDAFALRDILAIGVKPYGKDYFLRRASAAFEIPG